MVNENGKLNNVKNLFTYSLNHLFTLQKVAFTLAEVLITLAIIGVVAAITLPTLISNLNERINSERHANIVQKVTRAMEQMRANGELVRYNSTEEFIEHLQKYLKITKICYRNNIASCWPTSIVQNKNGEKIEVTRVRTGKYLNLKTKTNNVGLILADGASIILNYDNNNEGFDVSDRVTAETKSLPVGFGKSKDFAYTSSVTNAIDFVMDVNGSKRPNSETDKTVTPNKYHDIRSFKGASFTEGCPGEYGTLGCILYIGQNPSYVNCRDSNSVGYEFCKPHSSNRLADYWAGAKYECSKYGLELPNVGTLQDIQKNRSAYLSLKDKTGNFWSSTEWSGSPSTGASDISLVSGSVRGNINKGSSEPQIICIGD